MLSLTALLLPSWSFAQSSESVVFWPGPDTSAQVRSEARAELGRFFDVIDLPAPSPEKSGQEGQRLRAKATAVVEEARNHYYEAQFGEASSKLSAFLETNTADLVRGGASDVLQGAALWAGAAATQNGDTEVATRWFLLAMAFGTQEIDRSLFAPEVTRAFGNVREDRTSATPTKVMLSLTPQDARCHIDAAPLEPGASSVDLAGGPHVFVVHRVGFRGEARLVEVAGPTQTIELSLQPATGQEASDHVADLRRERQLDSADATHLSLVLSATDTQVAALVTADGIVELVDRSGRQVSLPEGFGVSESPAPDTPEPARPPWRRWWFWTAIIGGAAAVATGVGLGVYFGTQNRDTFTLVPAVRE